MRKADKFTLYQWGLILLTWGLLAVNWIRGTHNWGWPLLAVWMAAGALYFGYRAVIARRQAEQENAKEQGGL